MVDFMGSYAVSVGRRLNLYMGTAKVNNSYIPKILEWKTLMQPLT